MMSNFPSKESCAYVEAVATFLVHFGPVFRKDSTNTSQNSLPPYEKAARTGQTSLTKEACGKRSEPRAGWCRKAELGPAEHRLRRGSQLFSVIATVACQLLKWVYFLLRCFAGGKKLKSKRLIFYHLQWQEQHHLLGSSCQNEEPGFNLRRQQTNPKCWTLYQITSSTLQKHQPQRTKTFWGTVLGSRRLRKYDN